MRNLEIWLAGHLLAELTRGTLLCIDVFLSYWIWYRSGANYIVRWNIYFKYQNFRENCGEKMEEFLKRCFYHSGQYDSLENFAELDKKLCQHEVC